MSRSQGLGFIPAYSAVLYETERFSRCKMIGTADGLRMEVFAMTAQRRLQHPGVAAITVKASSLRRDGSGAIPSLKGTRIILGTLEAFARIN